MQKNDGKTFLSKSHHPRFFMTAAWTIPSHINPAVMLWFVIVFLTYVVVYLSERVIIPNWKEDTCMYGEKKNGTR